MKNLINSGKPLPHMNPYLAGVLLGLLLLATIFLTGRGLGASGAAKSVMVATATTLVPDHTDNSEFYQEYKESHPESPLKSWLLFEVIGVLIGGFVSGLISNRLGFKIDKGPKITSKGRLAAALIGGALFGIGASFGRGCTSGGALTGMAVLSTAGFILMLTIFGGGYLFAYFFRKLWL